jgi:hypothetical protein
MEYAARLPRTPSRQKLVAPIVALLVGAGVATGAYALIDNGGSTAQPAKVIVVETPGPNAADIPGKNEAATAAAISPSQAAAIPGKDESATAAAISRSSGVELRGSKASQSSQPASQAQSPAQAQRTDPHGPASFLH